MLKPSTRGDQMPASPIRKLVPFAEEAKKRGIKVHHLNIGQPDIETPPSVMDAVRQADIKVLAYSHSAGNESYRKKLVSYYQKVGIRLDAGEIIITTGGSEAIVFGMMSCLDEGDEIIIPEPFYANYNGFAVMAGVKIVPITSHIENGFALPPIVEFENKIRETLELLLSAKFDVDEAKDFFRNILVKEYEVYMSLCHSRVICIEDISHVTLRFRGDVNALGLEISYVLK